MQERVIRILLVEDEAELASRIGKSLSGAGFVVDHAADGHKGWAMGKTQAYDAVVLDLGLPELSGLDVLKRWRAAGVRTPVLILTARSGWAERVKGLNAGADDYLEKPFQIEEILARLRALTRRAAGITSSILRHDGIELDASAGVVTKAGRPIELTARELRILNYLMHRPRKIVSQSELLDHIYAFDEPRQPNTVEVYIARLRKKLGHDAIHTVRGLGYRLGSGEHVPQ